MRIPFRTKERNPWRNFLFGLAGGAAGTLAMGYYWKAVKAITKKDPRKLKSQGPPKSLDDISLVGVQHKKGEGATEAVGRILYEKAEGHEPVKEVKQELSEVVHWSYGAIQGGLYSAVQSQLQIPEVPSALIYSTGMWVFGSNLAVPALGLTEGPSRTPAESHLYALVAHWVYGLTAAGVRRLLNALIP